MGGQRLKPLEQLVLERVCGDRVRMPQGGDVTIDRVDVGRDKIVLERELRLAAQFGDPGEQFVARRRRGEPERVALRARQVVGRERVLGEHLFDVRRRGDARERAVDGRADRAWDPSEDRVGTELHAPQRHGQSRDDDGKDEGDRGRQPREGQNFTVKFTSARVS